MPYELKERMSLLVKQYVDATLKKHGFKKKSTNYYKTEGDLVFMFNVQNSAHFEDVEYSFFINCGVHSIEIDRTIGKVVVDSPKHYDCTFYDRIEYFTKKKYQSYSVTIEANTDRVGASAVEDLELVIAQYKSITSNEDLVDKIARFELYTLFEQDFLRYLAKKGRIDKIQEFLKTFAERFKDKERGARILENYKKLLLDAGVDLATASR